MRNIYTFIILFSLSIFSLSAQNEFVNDGGAVYLESGAELYVHGEVKLNSGSTLDNEGTIEMRGDNFQSNGVNWISNASTLTGAGKVRFYENGTGNDYRISGGNVKFSNLEVDIFDIALGVNAAFIDVQSNAEVSGTLELNNGKLVTGANEVYVSSSNANAVATTGNFGDNQSNYVEGRLKRAVANNNNYVYPIGKATKGYNRVDLNMRTVPGGTDAIVGEFNEMNDIGSVFFRAGLIDCSAFTNGRAEQHMDINGMADGYGYWSFSPDGSTTGWDYDMSAYPDKNELLTQNPSAVYFRILKSPSGTVNSSKDWTTDITTSGTLCTGVNIVGSDFVDPLQNYATVNSIDARSLNSFSDFGIAKSSTVGLPIELVSLDANPIDNDYIRVDWVTATEVNNAGFEVQRSVDGVNFKEIGWVDGAGNSVDQLSYEFNDYDVEPNKTYYYRLKQIDYDGEYENTYIVNAMITKEGVLTVGNFVPNPTNGTSSIQINSSEVHKVRVTIFTTLGQVMNIKDYEVNPGLNRLDFDFSMLADGTYHAVIVVDENEVHNKKVVITK